MERDKVKEGRSSKDGGDIKPKRRNPEYVYYWCWTRNQCQFISFERWNSEIALRILCMGSLISKVLSAFGIFSALCARRQGKSVLCFK